jgi:mono/diheme cytochrome c family protein
MFRTLNTLIAVLVMSIVGLLGFTGWVAPGSISPQEATPQPSPTPTQTGSMEKSWILVDLPADASQVEYGHEVYRLVCSACHGDKGQGLTPEWRATWAPADQNCWQSKCHGYSHPSDGFLLPYSPPITQAILEARYGTALDLFDDIKRTMPWYSPGSLTDHDAWTVTAYVLKLTTDIDPGTDLNAASAALIQIGGEAVSAPAIQAQPTPQPVPTPKAAGTPKPAPALPNWAIGAAVLVLAIGGATYWLIRRRSS